MKRLALFLLFASSLAAQQWSGIIAPSRAINWTNTAGLPATLPDGETTPNAWTPPTRTTICQNFTSVQGSAGSPVAATSINNAISSCAAGGVVLLSANAYINTNISPKSNVTLRIANGVTLFLYGNTRIVNNGSTGTVAAWTANYAAGTTTIQLASVSGFSAGSLAQLRQCNDGTTGVNNCTGTQADTGGIWNCAGSDICSEHGQGGQNPGQLQVVRITSVNSGANTITFTPGLYMPNWSATNTPWAQNIPNPINGFGLEGGTIDGTNGTSGHANVSLGGCYACWVVGTRNINGPGGVNIGPGLYTERMLIAHNYLTAVPPQAPENINANTDCDLLVINNIGEVGPPTESQAATCGDVYLYNFSHFGWSNNSGGTNQVYTGNVWTFHETGENFGLLEGNQGANAQWDNDHSTHNLESAFRNAFTANDLPYNKTQGIMALGSQGAARFFNWIGNVLGSPNINQYQCIYNSGGCGNAIYQIGATGAQVPDQLAFQSSFRWGNYAYCTIGDSHCNAVAWCGNSSSPGWSTTCGSVSEVPTSLPGIASAFNNPVPSSTTLPASFFFTIGAHPSGGTGLSWWKVCTNYPTCTTFQTQPFPTFGPDVTGGGPLVGTTTDYYNGHAYDIPAALAWKYLPIDPAYQSSYTFTGSWSGGTETLTVSGFPTGAVGAFQISAGPCAGSAEYLITGGSGSSTIKYAAASDPGCSSGTLLWPDIRQFNASLIYQADNTSGPTPTFTPTSVSFGAWPITIPSAPISVTLKNTGGSTYTATTWNVNNSKYSIQGNTCGTPSSFTLFVGASGFSLAPGASCSFQVVYYPQVINSADPGGATFADNAGNTQLTFSGIGAPLPPSNPTLFTLIPSPNCTFTFQAKAGAQ